MYKVNNSVKPCSSVSIVNFEQVNAGWDVMDDNKTNCHCWLILKVILSAFGQFRGIKSVNLIKISKKLFEIACYSS